MHLECHTYTYVFTWAVDNTMRNFVISLKNNNEKRKNHIKSEFAKQGIAFEFFDAVTPDQNEDILLRHDLKITPPLTKNEIACSLSHFMIWNKIVQEDIHFAAIFEDDIYLGDGAGLFLKSLEWIDHDLDIIKLEKGWQKTITTSLFSNKTIGDRRLYRLMGDHYGTAGYIIFNKGARYLIDYYSKAHVTNTIDSFIFGILLKNRDFNVHQLLPTLCVQDFILYEGHKNFPSAIAITKETPPEKKIKRSISYKLKRETKRALKKVAKPINSTINKAKLLTKLLWDRTVVFK